MLVMACAALVAQVGEQVMGVGVELSGLLNRLSCGIYCTSHALVHDAVFGGGVACNLRPWLNHVNASAGGLLSQEEASKSHLLEGDFPTKGNMWLVFIVVLLPGGMVHYLVNVGHGASGIYRVVAWQCHDH